MSVSTINLRKYLASKLPSKSLKNTVLNSNPECVIEHAAYVARLLDDLRKPSYIENISSGSVETITTGIAEYLPFNVIALHMQAVNNASILPCPVSILSTGFEGRIWLNTIISNHPMFLQPFSWNSNTYIALYIYKSLVITLCISNNGTKLVHYLRRGGTSKERWQYAR